MLPAPSTSIRNEDEIDLRELFAALWASKLTFAWGGLAGLVLAGIYAFGIAKPKYESSALLLPTQAPSEDQLGAAAALLGKKAGGSGDVDLYQSLLTSRTVIHKLLMTKIANESDTGRGRPEALAGILGVDTLDPSSVERSTQALAKSVIVDSKESGAGGILEIRFSARSPWLAQGIGNALLEIGQEELRHVRIERSSMMLSRLGAAVKQARLEWDSSASALTRYKDRNRSITLPEQILEASRLEIEKSTMEQKYLLARKEYELQLLEQAKATPPMMILDGANRPTRPAKSKRLIILLGSTIAGAMFAGFGSLGQRAMRDYMRNSAT